MVDRRLSAIIRVMPKKTLESLELELRDFAMAYPEATEDHPWGHRAMKVKGKAFVFLGGEKNTQELSMSVKLPQSRDMAADLPFAEPTGYGLGKSGWVTARFDKASAVPLDLMKAWIDESYRAIAPKKLIKTLG
jgi:predicted DNA-binding protein (MmcQ/YjbR family)